MARYIIKRLLIFIPILLLVSVIVFLFIRLIPGDPITIMLGQAGIKPDVAQEYIAKNGLDQPITTQYVYWLRNMLGGDFGNSILYKQPVLKMIGAKLPVTLMLSAGSIVIAALVSILLGTKAGVMASTGKHKGLARTVSSAPMIMLAIPEFVTAVLLLFAFAVWIPIFPATSGGSQKAAVGFWGEMYRYLLPMIAMSLATMAASTRMARSSVLEVSQEDYVVAARARGLQERIVRGRYIRRNALIPIITNLGIAFGGMVSGSVIVESVFSLPGIGLMMLDAIRMRDYPVIQAGVLLLAFAYMLINLVVDIVYTVIDPRIRRA